MIVIVSHTGMIFPAVPVGVVSQGQGSNRQEEDEAQNVVDDLEKRLVSSSRTPKVRDEKRQSNQNKSTDGYQSDVVTILEWPIHQLSTKIQRVNSDKDDGRYR